MTVHKPLYLFFAVIILTNSAAVAQTKAKKILSTHKSVAILPAFYFDLVDTTKLSYQAHQLKLLGAYRKEIGIDVQYKYYLPLMLNANKYVTFFRGADTVNRIMDSSGIEFSKTSAVNFKMLAELLKVDALIILELSERNEIYGWNQTSILFKFLTPSPTALGKIFDANSVINAVQNQTVSLNLVAKIYDGKSGMLVWVHSASSQNQYYHDAIRKMVATLQKDLPYHLKK